MGNNFPTLPLADRQGTHCHFSNVTADDEDNTKNKNAEGNDPLPLIQDDATCSDYGNYISTEKSFDENMNNVNFDGVYEDDREENVNIHDSSCAAILPKCMDNWQSTVGPYECDESEEKDIFCDTSRRSKRNQKIFLMPLFQSCNALLEQGQSASVDDNSETALHEAYYSEGEIYDTPNRKRRRRRQHQKTILSNSFGSYTSLTPLFFSTDPTYTDEELLMENGNDPTLESDLRPKINQDFETTILCRSFHVITTAALPWMTGTAINPLLRAAYLNRMNRNAVENALGETCTPNVFQRMGVVTLVIPWLFDDNDQSEVYGTMKFASKQDQEIHIRDWLRTSAALPLEADLETGGIHISFYDARYLSEFKSILPTVNSITNEIQEDLLDVCILDEPEHLNFLSATDHESSFTSLFSHVVGIMHTNYDSYLKGSVVGRVIAPVISILINLTTRYHCHKIIKLSDTLQIFAKEKECVMNVHGIRQAFLEEGKRRALNYVKRETLSSNGKIYFCGKLLWAKGLDAMIELEYAFKSITENYFQIHIVGSGPEEEEIRRAFGGRRTTASNRTKPHSIADDDDMTTPRTSSVKDKMDQFIDKMPRSRYEFRKGCIPSSFLGRMDHAAMGEDFKIFLNPSVTEVLCTTTAEALAMGKFVIIPSHPSNTFFQQFPNCLMYDSKAHFVTRLQYAMENTPIPLSELHSFTLTWEAATERLIGASIITKREAKRRERVGQFKADTKAAEYLKGGIFETIRNYVRNCMKNSDEEGWTGAKSAIFLEK